MSKRTQTFNAAQFVANAAQFVTKSSAASLLQDPLPTPEPEIVPSNPRMTERLNAFLQKVTK